VIALAKLKDRLASWMEANVQLEIGRGYCRGCGKVYEGLHFCALMIVGECHGRCNGLTRVLTWAGNCRRCLSTAITNRRIFHRWSGMSVWPAA